MVATTNESRIAEFSHRAHRRAQSKNLSDLRWALWLSSSAIRNPQSFSGSGWRSGPNQDFGSRLENQIFPVLNQYRSSADAGAEDGADGRAFTAASDAADDR